jgi:hypothetical protein
MEAILPADTPLATSFGLDPAIGGETVDDFEADCAEVRKSSARCRPTLGACPSPLRKKFRKIVSSLLIDSQGILVTALTLLSGPSGRWEVIQRRSTAA